MQMTSEQYVARGGIHCPHCNSTDIETGSMRMHESGIEVSVECHDCEAEWVDNYELTGYSE